MKAIVEIGEIGAKVEVDSGEAIVSHQKDFAVSMKEVEHPQINEISVFPRNLWTQIERKDGWVIDIKISTPFGEQNLIVARFKKPKFHEAIVFEYLTTEGKWLREPLASSSVMKIPIFFPKEG